MDKREELTLSTELGMLLSSPTAIDKCLRELTPAWFEPGSVLIEQNASGDVGYFLTHGRVRRMGGDVLESCGQVGTGVLLEQAGSGKYEHTVVVETRAKLWKLERGTLQQTGPLDSIRNNRILCHLTTQQQQVLACNAEIVQATAGQVLLRHGEVNNKLYFIQSGLVVGVIRDGGVNSLLSLQRDGEVLWRYGENHYFGEDSLVFDGQTTSATDAIVESETATLFTISHDLMRKMNIDHTVRRQMYLSYISRILQSSHRFNNVSTDIIQSRISSQAQFMVLVDRQPFQFREHAAKKALVLVVTQGALTFKERDGDHWKNVGRLEVGHSIQLSTLNSKSDLYAAAVDHTCLLLALERVPHTPKLIGRLQKFQSTGNILSYREVEDEVSHVSPNTESKKLNKRQAFGGCYETEESGPDSPMSVQSCPSPVQGKMKRFKVKCFGSNSSTNAGSTVHRPLSALRLPPPPKLGNTTTPPPGYASYKKTKKQLNFLKNLKSINTRSTEETKTTHMDSDDDMECTEELPHQPEKSIISSSPGVKFFRGLVGSPKKRKTGLVLSLNSLEKVDVLGKGAFGTVSLVCHKESNAIYALKQLDKNQVVAKRQVTRVQSEKSIMEKFGQHPFITNFIRTFRDSKNVYLLLEAGLGGDLFDLIASRKVQALTTEETRFFGAQVICAVEFLHKHNVVYRDIKPENTIICLDGYLRLTDFGMAKELGGDGRTYTLCGTPTFLAPEVLKLGGYSCSVDWWSLGVFLYEVSTGTFPFRATSFPSLRVEHTAFEQDYPNNALFEAFEKDGKPQFGSVLQELLHPDPLKRLGKSSQGGGSADDVKNHPFFGSVNWDALLRREVIPPGTIFECVRSSRVLNATNKYKNRRSLSHDTGEMMIMEKMGNNCSTSQGWDQFF